MKNVKGKIWIDLDNSPHVPFFKPIIAELEKRGYDMIVTARDCFQVCALATLHNLSHHRIGRHYGKNRIMKGLGLTVRAMQMAPVIMRYKPDLALSHGSRSQLIVSKVLRIPSLTMFDYEHAKGLHFAHPDCVMVPELIPATAISSSLRRILRYPGIKEDVYVPEFVPEQGILRELGINDGELVVTVRPPATEAHYFKPQSEELFEAVMDRIAPLPGIRMILLPRNERQELSIREKWPEPIARRKIIIPADAVAGLNLIWHSDLVISGGGTMNREAAALGVPVYSIFRGEVCAIDSYLAASGRLTLIENVQGVREKIDLVKWARPVRPEHSGRPALQRIVEGIEAFIAGG